MSENKQKKPAKKWTAPQLIVLARGKPEERVLDGCKSESQSGADSAYNICAVNSYCPDAWCMPTCMGITDS